VLRLRRVSINSRSGRRVRVVWHLDNDAPGYSRGLYFLAIYDREPSSGTGNILFVGSGGRRDSVTSGAQNPLKDLPFSVSSQALGCGQPPMDARSYLDATIQRPWCHQSYCAETRHGALLRMCGNTRMSGNPSPGPPSGGAKIFGCRACLPWAKSGRRASNRVAVAMQPCAPLGSEGARRGASQAGCRRRCVGAIRQAAPCHDGPRALAK
jgi:hypothetical protein